MRAREIRFLLAYLFGATVAFFLAPSTVLKSFDCLTIPASYTASVGQKVEIGCSILTNEFGALCMGAEGRDVAQLLIVDGGDELPLEILAGLQNRFFEVPFESGKLSALTCDSTATISQSLTIGVFWLSWSILTLGIFGFYLVRKE